MNILQIVPRISAPASGVLDYALRVAEGLSQAYGTRTIFLAGDNANAEDKDRLGWPSHALTSKSAASLAEGLEAAYVASPFQCMFIHVSGYGYAKRGAPFWLVRGLAMWLAKRRDIKVIGVFHELFATNYPWRSSFWFGPLQADVTKRIWRLCDVGITTNTLYLEQLRAWRPRACPRIELLPVVSTVGEPHAIAPFNEREPTAIVFASPGVEKTLYADCQIDLERATRVLGIQKIVDIGRRNVSPPTSVAGVPVELRGLLPAKEISALMQTARYGFLFYDASRLGKSTVFAAYAAHGLVPVCFGSDAVIRDDLIEGRDLLRSPVEPVSESDGRGIQAAARTWYAPHSARRLVDTFASLAGLNVTTTEPGYSVPLIVDSGKPT